MTKATDKVLGQLHGKLAASMLKALEAADEAANLIEEFSEEIPPEVYAYLEKQRDASPALLTAVSKFLKDNDITCAIEDTPEMTELAQTLAQKRRVSTLVPVE